MARIRIVGIVFLLTIQSLASDLATSYQEARALAENQEGAPTTGNYFVNTLLPYYSKNYAPVLQSCFAEVRQPDSGAFSFVVAIGSSGRAMRIYQDRTTNIFLCLRESLQNGVFPSPPVSPYYLHIDMRFADDAPPTADSGKDAPPLIVEPNKYSYTFGVPQGWEFSFEQAHRRGATLAFFPKGGSFNSSSAVIYLNEIDDGCAMDCMKVLPDRVANTIREIRNESPTVQITSSVPVRTKDGGTALIRVLKGATDPRDPNIGKDDEAVAFIGHDETIILVVLSARDSSSWPQDFRAFEDVLSGHKFFNCKSPELRIPCSR